MMSGLKESMVVRFELALVPGTLEFFLRDSVPSLQVLQLTLSLGDSQLLLGVLLKATVLVSLGDLELIHGDFLGVSICFFGVVVVLLEETKMKWKCQKN